MVLEYNCIFYCDCGYCDVFSRGCFCYYVVIIGFYIDGYDDNDDILFFTKHKYENSYMYKCLYFLLLKD